MSPATKVLIGLAGALAAGWAAHGPLGQGEAFAARLEAQAKAVVREAELPGVQARIERNPLRRRVVLSGSANDFQREGQGGFPGLNDRIRALPGMAGLRWEDNECCARR